MEGCFERLTDFFVAKPDLTSQSPLTSPRRHESIYYETTSKTQVANGGVNILKI